MSAIYLWVSYHNVPETILTTSHDTIQDLLVAIATAYRLPRPAAARLALRFPHDHSHSIALASPVGHVLQCVFGDAWCGTVNPACDDFVQVVDVVDSDPAVVDMMVGFRAMAVDETAALCDPMLM